MKVCLFCLIYFLITLNAYSEIIGDVNFDSQIDIVEAVYALRVCANLEPPLTSKPIIQNAKYIFLAGENIQKGDSVCLKTLPNIGQRGNEVTGQNGFSNLPALPNYEKWIQTFTIEDIDLILNGIELYLYGEAQVSLYKINETKPYISSSPIWVSQIQKFEPPISWVKILIDATIMLENNTTYGILVTGGNVGGGYWGELDGDIYQKGNQLVWVNEEWDDYKSSNKDFAFNLLLVNENNSSYEKISQTNSNSTSLFKQLQNTNSYEKWIQTFKTLPGMYEFAGVELFLQQSNDGNGSVQVSLHQISDEVPYINGEPIWKSSTITFDNTSLSWIKIIPDEHIPISENTTYGLMITGGENSGGYWGESYNNPYEDGFQIAWIDNQWVDFSNSNKDFAFKAYFNSLDTKVKVYKTDASNTNKICFVGIADNNTLAENEIVINITGISFVKFDTSQENTLGKVLYLSNNPGKVSIYPGSNSVKVGRAISNNKMLLFNFPQ